MSTTFDPTAQPDARRAEEPLRGGDALDALLFQQSERVCELELLLEQQLDELAVALDAGLHSVEQRESAARRESEDVDAQLQKLARRDAETRQQRRQIARILRSRKAELGEAAAGDDEGHSAVPAESGENDHELRFLKEELESQRAIAEQAQRELASCQEQLALSDAPAEDGRELEHLQQRLELALADIRELKQENAGLRQRVDRQPPALGAAGEGLDWESQKARLLTKLEDDDESQSNDSGEQARRVAELQRVLEHREDEIGELRLRLQQTPAADATNAVSDEKSGFIDSILDNDELIRDEREKLLAMQEEWREKLRISEIEISVERAKLARERSQLEEQLRVLKRERDQLSAIATNKPKGDKEGKRASQGRWLARLGLSDE